MNFLCLSYAAQYLFLISKCFVVPFFCEGSNGREGGWVACVKFENLGSIIRPHYFLVYHEKSVNWMLSQGSQKLLIYALIKVWRSILMKRKY